VSDLRVVDHPGVGDCDWRLGAVDGWMGAWESPHLGALDGGAHADNPTCGLATPFMKKPKRPRDPNQLTKLIVDIA
jgi:hypothetical protein